MILIGMHKVELKNPMKNVSMSWGEGGNFFFIYRPAHILHCYYFYWFFPSL